MEKHEAANESPPAYAEVALALDWYPGSPPPPYPIPDHPQFHSTTLQFPLSTNQLTVARPLHDVVAPLPPQRNQHLQQQQVIVYRQRACTTSPCILFLRIMFDRFKTDASMWDLVVGVAI